MKPSLDKLFPLAEQAAAQTGLRLYDLEFQGTGNGKILRVYIDRNDPAGVSLDDCSKFSNALSVFLDADESLIDGNYYLEVSSPGVERVLKTPWHFAEAVGKTIFVNLSKPVGELAPKSSGANVTQKKLTGLAKSFEKDVLNIEVEGQEISVPLEFVSKAHVVFDFSKKQEKA
jgi:ribosome maturation factor RimP